MSAFFSVCYEDRIEILTDGAHYNPDGCLVALQTKIFPNGSKPFAVTGRGHSVSLERFARLFNRVADACVSVDDALREIDREIQKLGLMAIEKAPQPVEVIIPCISETKGPINVYLATQDVYGYAAPFTMSVAPSEVGGGPAVPCHELEAHGITPGAASEGLSKVGITFFELMRRQKGTNPAAPELPPIYGIGGFIDHTVIRKEGVVVNRIHTWNDEVGKTINPFNQVVLAA